MHKIYFIINKINTIYAKNDLLLVKLSIYRALKFSSRNRVNFSIFIRKIGIFGPWLNKRKAENAIRIYLFILYE